MKLIAVYGSLRKGLYNNKRYMGGAKLLGVETIWGFDMYSLGSYPYIIEGEGKVIFEIYDVPDDAAADIRDMELGANYQESQVETGFGTAIIYVMTGERHAWYGRRGRHTLVPKGDWRKHSGDDMYYVMPDTIRWNETGVWDSGILTNLTTEGDSPE